MDMAVFGLILGQVLLVGFILVVCKDITDAKIEHKEIIKKFNL